jgi:hypothetical protein
MFTARSSRNRSLQLRRGPPRKYLHSIFHPCNCLVTSYNVRHYDVATIVEWQWKYMLQYYHYSKESKRSYSRVSERMNTDSAEQILTAHLSRLRPILIYSAHRFIYGLSSCVYEKEVWTVDRMGRARRRLELFYYPCSFFSWPVYMCRFVSALSLTSYVN